MVEPSADAPLVIRKLVQAIEYTLVKSVKRINGIIFFIMEKLFNVV